MEIEKVKQFYIRRIEKSQQLKTIIKQRIYITGTIRLFIVLGALISVYYFWDKGTPFNSGIILLSLILFLYFVVRHNRLYEKKAYLETSISSDENELRAIDYDFSAFDGANERISGAHPFSLDLDVFGDKSLFQAVNRSCTIHGKKTLADWFEHPLNEKSAILERQQAVKELSDKPDLRHHFMITGMLNPGKASDLTDILDFVNHPNQFNTSNLWKIACIAIPCFWAAFILLLYMQVIPIQFLGFAITVCMIIGESQVKRINILQDLTGKKVKVFSVYSQLMQIIETENPDAELLRKIKSGLIQNDKKASQRIKQLSRLLGDLDVRFNVVARIVLNTVFLWDIRKSIAIENWKDTNAAHLEGWIKNLGEFDALCSFGTFTFTHPGYTFPEITTDYFEMKGKSLGHPLIHRDKCVKNDAELPFNPYFIIITGANMAGKSTYLRTIGINFLLAKAGLPVCADSLTIYPARLYTSLRTTDSLTDDESYFFAELKRLKAIIDELDDGIQLFIILDEILKGTNSVDKQKGSLGLIRQFIALNTCGIIATHDLLLGSLESKFPGNIRNMRFEADIAGDELHFSYKLRPGVAQNMNACFLMEKMGIIVEK